MYKKINPFNPELGKDFNFLHMTMKAKFTKEKLDKFSCIKMNIFHSSKDTIREGKAKADWEKILAKHTSDKGHRIQFKNMQNI